MKKLKRRWWGAFAAGILLLIWGATSAFSDWRALQALQPDALDNPDAAGSSWIMPANPAPASGNPSPAVGTANTPTPFQPGGENPLPTQDQGGDSQIFSVPKGNTPVSNAPVQTPQPVGMVPDRIVIPAIHLDAPILKVPYRLVKDDATGMVLQQWSVPDKFAVGWQGDSAMLGVKGNTVLDGHHNVYGMVFRYLIDLVPGQLIEVYSGDTVFTYQITNKMILRERNMPLSVRFANARWVMPTNDERITLVTCWPFTSNTHRLIIVAVPVANPTTSSSTPGATP